MNYCLKRLQSTKTAIKAQIANIKTLPNAAGIKKKIKILNIPKIKNILAPTSDTTVSQKKNRKNSLKQPIYLNNTPEDNDISCLAF